MKRPKTENETYWVILTPYSVEYYDNPDYKGKPFFKKSRNIPKITLTVFSDTEIK